MKSTFTLILLTIFTLSLNSSCTPKEAPKEEYSGARFFSWANYSKNRDWDKFFTEFTDVGFDGLIISGGADDLASLAKIAKKYNVEIHAWMWTMNNGGIANSNPEYLDVNQQGHSLKDSMAYVDYYRFLSPAIDSVRIKIAQGVEKLAQTEGITSV